ncbi:MAG: hypothetical protein Q9217_003584 [Psora testacea]
MFNPMPYQGYQPANNPSSTAPPPYGEPPARYAQFDTPGYRGLGKGGEDALPAMPSWKDAQNRRVEEQGTTNRAGEDMEMGKLQKPALASTTNLPAQHEQQHGFSAAEADSNPVNGPHEVPTVYTGPDFGVGAGEMQHQQYTGPDFSTPPQQQQQSRAYSAYAPSESTLYEPSHANEPQELGTTYSNTLPPLSPTAQQTGFGGAPGVLQAGRRQGQGQNAWRDV